MNNDVARVDNPRRAVEAANTIAELKDVRDRLESVRSYMRRSGKFTGEEYYEVAEAKVRAEWKAGRVLRGVERSEGGRPSENSYQDGKGFLSMVAHSGLATMVAYRWQTMSWLPDIELISYFTKQCNSKKDIKSSDVVKLGEKHKPVPGISAIGDDYTLYHADIANGLPDIADGSVDVIITDPPYPAEYLDCYEHLSDVAARVLKSGGLCLAMAGQSYLPDVMRLLGGALNYHWTLAYLTPGQSGPQWARHINTFWKPVLVFVKGEFDGAWSGDVVKSDANDKRFHDWGQSESGMARLVEKYSEPGATVLDPFVGGGATAIAALSHGRRFIGSDIEDEQLTATLRRIEQFLDEARELHAAS